MSEIGMFTGAFARHAEDITVTKRKLPVGRGGVVADRIVVTIRRTPVEELRLVFDPNTHALVDSWAGTINLNAEGAFHDPS